MKVIGIDIGTTTISGVVLDDTGVLEARTIENSCFIQTEKEWERIQNAEEIVKKAGALLDELLGRHSDTKRIGLTGQMHGIVYFNQDGISVSPLYTWQDARGSLCADGQIPLTEEIQKKCGIRAASGYGLVTHIYNLRHQLVPQTAVGFCTIMDYFGMRLTGRKVPLIHAGNAAGFGFFDGRNMHFETEKLAGMGVEATWLPPICTEVELLGTYRGCEVTTAIGDNQASFLGSAGKEPNTLLINMGTGGQISILSDQYFTADEIEARPFLDGNYLLVGASLCGGKAYALLEHFFRSFVAEATGIDQPLYGTLEKLARAGKERAQEKEAERRLQVETTFDGTRAHPELGGSITNLFSDNFTPEAFAYGVLEGMGQELYHMYRMVQAGTAIKIKRMIGSGNGLRKNPVLCEIMEELFGTKLVLAQYEEEAAVGAAMSGMEPFAQVAGTSSKDR